MYRWNDRISSASRQEHDDALYQRGIAILVRRLGLQERIQHYNVSESGAFHARITTLLNFLFYIGCMNKLEHQQCPFCHGNRLTLTEDSTEVPYFGKVYLFSMKCGGCGFSKADVEAEEQKEPVKLTFTIEDGKDMAVRVVKSSNATVKIPQMKMTVSPGPASIGYVSNIKGMLDRFVEVIKSEQGVAEEDEEKRRCKLLLKKIWRVKNGDDLLKIIVEDPSGNSAIVSDKAKVEKLNVKQE